MGHARVVICHRVRISVTVNSRHFAARTTSGLAASRHQCLALFAQDTMPTPSVALALALLPRVRVWVPETSPPLSQTLSIRTSTITYLWGCSCSPKNVKHSSSTLHHVLIYYTHTTSICLHKHTICLPNLELWESPPTIYGM